MPRSIAAASKVTFFFIAFLLGATVAADTLQVIELRHRPAMEVEPILRPLLKPDEAVSATGYQLILRASDARRAEIERIVATLDVAPRQLLFTVRQTTAQNSERRRDSVSGDVSIGTRGRVVIPPGDAARRGGTSVTGDGLRYDAERRSETADNVRTQILRVQEGKAAFIRIAQSAPAVQRVIALTGRGPVVYSQGIDVSQFSTGFDVLARVHGDRVQLDIIPRLSGGRDPNGAFRFQELQTSVTARLGEWIDLGGAIGESSDVNRTILQSASTQANEETRISLKVE